ncbi:MAG: insulinase family protein [Planctomycetes bacterium]|nr:insulinase family protein [Planctomycetota bacterium]
MLEILLALLPALAAPAVQDAEREALRENHEGLFVEERLLNNGLRVVVAPRAGVPVVACRVVVRGGAAADAPYPPGFQELLVRVMDKGSDRLGVRDFEKERALARRVDDIEDALALVRAEAKSQFRRGDGPDPDDPVAQPPALAKLRDGLTAVADLHRRELIPDELRSLYSRAGARRLRRLVSADASLLEVTLPAQRLELFFAMESERLQRAVVRDLAGERDRLREERLAEEARFSTLRAEEALRAMLWGNHPYGAPAPGAMALDDVTRADLEQARERAIHPQNVIFVLTGDVTSEAAFELANRYLGSWKSAPRSEPPGPRTGPVVGPRRLEAAADGTPRIVLLWPTPPAGHRDEAALAALSRGAGGEDGSLIRALRYARTNPTTVKSTFAPARFGGTFRLEIGARRNEDLPALEQALLGAIRAGDAAEISDESVARLRTIALHAHFDRLSSVETAADALAQAESCGSWRDLASFPSRIAALSAADLQRVMRETLTPDRRCMLVLRSTRETTLPAAASRPAAAATNSFPAVPASIPASAPAPDPASMPASGPASAPAPAPDSGASSKPASRPADEK